jgi:hypothetical protein
MPRMSDLKPQARGADDGVAMGLDESGESPQKADAKIKDVPSWQGSRRRRESDSGLHPVAVKGLGETHFQSFRHNLLFFILLYCARTPAVTKFVRVGSQAAKADIFSKAAMPRRMQPRRNPARINVNEAAHAQRNGLA